MGTDARPMTNRTRPRLRSKLLLAGGAVVVTIALIESALWCFHPLPRPAATRIHKYLPSFSAIGPAPRTILFDPGPLAGVTPGRVEVAVNRWGFLYPEERHRRIGSTEIRIATVGGSTVECSALAAKKRWPAVLETRLRTTWPKRRVSVLNLGISAQDTRTHMATACNHITNLDVDLVVFMLGANDLFRVGGPFRPMLGSDNFYEPADARPWKAIFRATQIGRHMNRRTDPSSRELRTTPYFHKQAVYQASLTIPDDALEVPPTGLVDYARNLTTLAGICKEHGIRVLFVTQPTMLTATPTEAEKKVLWGFHANGRGVSPANFVELLGSLNAQLLATCRARGYAHLDLAARIPTGLTCFYDQVHFNERGAEQAAAALVEPIRELMAR